MGHKKIDDLEWSYTIFAVVLMMLLFLLMLGLMTGCSNMPTTSTVAPPIRYELMLSGTIDGTSFQGIGLGSSAPAHQMTIVSPIAVNYFTMESCHRSIQFNDVIEMPWYNFVWHSGSKSFDFTYTEAPTIEDNGECILRFCAFSKTVGSPPVSCAIVDFHSDKYQLPAKNICNGVSGDATGTAMCHTQTGLIERFQLPGPSVVAPQVITPSSNTAPYWITNQCVGSFIDANQSLFQYQMPSQECSIVFMEKSAPYRRAKLTVIPYDQSQYPGPTQ